jgi:hypothetical protein
MRNLSIFLAAALLSAVGPAQSADLYHRQSGVQAAPSDAVADPITAANNQVAIQFVATNFDYAEREAGILLDTEKGWVLGVGAEISVMQNFIVPNFYFDAQASYLNGKTDYLGSYWGGVYGSLAQKDPAQVTDLDFRVGKGFAVSTSFMATPFIGAGFHQWDRDLGSYAETYSHGYIGGGLLLQWAATDRLVIFTSGLVGTTFAPSFTATGSYGFTDNLGESLIWKAGGGIDYAFADHWHAHAKVELTEFDYGHSGYHDFLCANAIAAACGAIGVHEPNSQTELITVKAGIGYSWGGGYVPLK